MASHMRAKQVASLLSPFICCNIYFCRFLITRAVEMLQFTCHLLVMEYFDECL